jgi:hypothetical protein
MRIRVLYHPPGFNFMHLTLLIGKPAICNDTSAHPPLIDILGGNDNDLETLRRYRLIVEKVEWKVDLGALVKIALGAAAGLAAAFLMHRWTPCPFGGMWKCPTTYILIVSLGAYAPYRRRIWNLK